MQLPVDIPEVLKIATDMKEVASTPISVSVLIDDTADGHLSGHVRAAFASDGAHTRVTIGYLDAGTLEPTEGLDMAVIVAGTSDKVGAQAGRLRDGGVPVMVVADDADAVCARASEAGDPIPSGDVVSPVRLEAKVPFLKGALPVIGSRFRRDSEIEGTSEDGDVIESAVADGEVPLDADTLRILDTRMGEWIIAACADKKLAFAYSFPFVRRPLALDAVNSTSLQNGAVGLVPFIPGADMPIMTLNQIKMVLQIATAYGQTLDADRIKEIVAIVAGAFLCRNVVRSLTKVIPVAGWVFSGAMGFAATEAMGRAMMEYFEAGGDMVGVAKVMQTARDEATKGAKAFAGSSFGKKAMAYAKDIGTSVASNLTNQR